MWLRNIVRAVAQMEPKLFALLKGIAVHSEVRTAALVLLSDLVPLDSRYVASHVGSGIIEISWSLISQIPVSVSGTLRKCLRAMTAYVSICRQDASARPLFSWIIPKIFDLISSSVADDILFEACCVLEPMLPGASLNWSSVFEIILAHSNRTDLLPVTMSALARIYEILLRACPLQTLRREDGGDESFLLQVLFRLLCNMESTSEEVLVCCHLDMLIVTLVRLAEIRNESLEVSDPLGVQKLQAVVSEKLFQRLKLCLSSSQFPVKSRVSTLLVRALLDFASELRPHFSELCSCISIAISQAHQFDKALSSCYFSDGHVIHDEVVSSFLSSLNDILDWICALDSPAPILETLDYSMTVHLLDFVNVVKDSSVAISLYIPLLSQLHSFASKLKNAFVSAMHAGNAKEFIQAADRIILQCHEAQNVIKSRQSIPKPSTSEASKSQSYSDYVRLSSVWSNAADGYCSCFQWREYIDSRPSQ